MWNMRFQIRIFMLQFLVFSILWCLSYIPAKWCGQSSHVKLLPLSHQPLQNLQYYPKNFRYCPFFAAYNFSICIYNPQYDQLISATLIKGEMWEKTMVDHIRRWLIRDQSLNLIDVGANIGVYSLAATGVGHKAVAIEPMPKSLELLRLSIKQKRLQDDILVVPFAVSDGYYNLTLETSWTNQGRSVMQTEPCTPKNGHFCTLIESIMLDDLLSLPEFSITFKKSIMKIDIEGHEIPTLMAASKLWQTLDIVVVIMEWEWIKIQWPKNSAKVDKFISFMENMHYSAKEPLYGRELSPKEKSSWPNDVVWTKKSFYF